MIQKLQWSRYRVGITFVFLLYLPFCFWFVFNYFTTCTVIQILLCNQADVKSSHYRSMRDDLITCGIASLLRGRCRFDWRWWIKCDNLCLKCTTRSTQKTVTGDVVLTFIALSPTTNIWFNILNSIRKIWCETSITNPKHANTHTHTHTHTHHTSHLHSTDKIYRIHINHSCFICEKLFLTYGWI